MTYRTTSSHHQTKVLAAGDSPALPCTRVATLLAEDDIVRREFRNAAILAGNRAARQDSAHSPQPAGR